MEQNEHKQNCGSISYAKLMWQSIPEIFGFQILSGIPLALLGWALNKLMKLVAESGGAAITTANLNDLLLSWRGPVTLLLGVALVAVFAVFEIFAQIYLYDDILKGRRVRLLEEIGKGFRALLKFFCPSGLLVLLYIFIAVPLIGIGFSISLTEKFYIPNFIMEVVHAKPLYNVAYYILMAALLAVSVCGVFTLHGVLIDNLKPSAAFKASFKLLKSNWKKFLGAIALTIIVLVAVIVLVAILLSVAEGSLETEGAALPEDVWVEPSTLMDGSITDEEMEVAVYRVLCTLVVLGGGSLLYFVNLFCSAFFLMRITRCYLEFSSNPEIKWPPRPRRRSAVVKMILLLVGLTLFVALISALLGVAYNVYFDRPEPVHIVAHRTGGVMAPENSMEGIELAIEHGCYACETDIQRTKDGYYIINHDDDFKRLTGVAKKPGDMTLEEVRELVITDPRTGATSKVPELEEMLDAIKGRVKLFIELKGATADTQMVDDVVKMIREKDCVQDVALISLKYNVIDYAETKYPEFETGLLIFAGIGDVTRVNCDLMILEEEMSTLDQINRIHEGGKDVYVWTINTKDGMYKFLSGKCDGIITDQINLALQVQEELENRSELQVINDAFGDIWE